jgi:integrase
MVRAGEQKAHDYDIRTRSPRPGPLRRLSAPLEPPSRLSHLSTRQYARIVQGWVASIGLNPATRTKAALIYRKTGNLRAVQLLLGHTKLESTVRYLGVEVDDAIAISEGVDL